jgi:hypothetical protein
LGLAKKYLALTEVVFFIFLFFYIPNILYGIFPVRGKIFKPDAFVISLLFITILTLYWKSLSAVRQLKAEKSNSATESKPE